MTLAGLFPSRCSVASLLAEPTQSHHLAGLRLCLVRSFLLKKENSELRLGRLRLSFYCLETNSVTLAGLFPSRCSVASLLAEPTQSHHLAGLRLCLVRSFFEKAPIKYRSFFPQLFSLLSPSSSLFLFSYSCSVITPLSNSSLYLSKTSTVFNSFSSKTCDCKLSATLSAFGAVTK